jgi:hypothetical protein
MADSDAKVIHRKETRTTQDHSDDMAHIVMKDDQMRGYMTGEPIKALCGKIWVPTRDYAGLPVCQKCTTERDRIVAGMKHLN